MTNDAAWYQWDGPRLVLQLQIQPKASKNEICDTRNGRLKIRLIAAPADGAANRCLVEYLADQFAVAKREVRLIRGTTGRQKTVIIDSPSNLPVKLNIRSPA
jgi:uncharacterized protein (TIGR00251 family)